MKKFVQKVEEQKESKEKEITPENIRDLLDNAMSRREALYQEISLEKDVSDYLNHDKALYESAIAWTKTLDKTATKEEALLAKKFKPSQFGIGLNQAFKMNDTSDAGYAKDFELREAIFLINKGRSK